MSWEEYEVPPEPKPKKRAGRPKGSTNRSKEELLSQANIEKLYPKIKPYIPVEQREYLEGVLRGEHDIDPIREYKLMYRLMSLLFSTKTERILNGEDDVNQAFAVFANCFRQASKEFVDIMNKEEEKLAEQQSEHVDDLVRVTERRTSLERLEEILSLHSS